MTEATASLVSGAEDTEGDNGEATSGATTTAAATTWAGAARLRWAGEVREEVVEVGAATPGAVEEDVVVEGEEEEGR